MSELLQLGRCELRWGDIISAYLIDDPAGIQFLLRKPPYVTFVSSEEEHYSELLSALEDKGLLLTPAEAGLAFRDFMNALLDKALNSMFENPQEARRVIALASEGGRPFHPRLALACVELSGGDLEELRRWCELARIDYRDVYVAAWYR